jgi:RNA polymerase sigma-54 factor
MQGLARVSQHLALTPQLQQSIRLLQLSTLELSQEVEQMLDDNPFLELNAEEAPREEFGLPQVDTPVRRDDLEAESASSSIAQAMTRRRWEVTRMNRKLRFRRAGKATARPRSCPTTANGAATPPRARTTWATTMSAPTPPSWRAARSRCTTFLHRQALALRLSEVDRAALRFLIESLNDDGYLEDSLASLAAGLAGTTWSRPKNWSTASAWRWACCSRWNPPAWARATWANA